MTREDEQEISDLIRKSDVGKYLVDVGRFHDRDGVWANFKRPERPVFGVHAEWDKDSAPESLATDLIRQARAKISH